MALLTWIGACEVGCPVASLAQIDRQRSNRNTKTGRISDQQTDTSTNIYSSRSCSTILKPRANMQCCAIPSRCQLKHAICRTMTLQLWRPASWHQQIRAIVTIASHNDSPRMSLPRGPSLAPAPQTDVIDRASFLFASSSHRVMRRTSSLLLRTPAS